jgi:hypothetical protein
MGDPALVHKTLEREIPLGEIPEPFGDMARRAMKHVHGVLDQVANDVVLGVYLTSKGTASLVLAADVKNDDTALGAVRGLNEIIHEALQSQARLAAEDPQSRFKVSFKPEGLRFADAKADLFTLSVPRSMEEDARNLGPFLTKKRLEVVTLVHEGVATVAIGAGARRVVSDIARGPGKDALASDPGLVSIRDAATGCQLCVTGDGVDFLRLRFLLLKATESEAATAKSIKQALARLKKITLDATAAMGLSVEDEQASAIVAVPRNLLFAKRSDAQALLELTELADRDGRPAEE